MKKKSRHNFLDYSGKVKQIDKIDSIYLDMLYACIFDKETSKENSSTNNISSNKTSNNIFNFNRKYELV